MSLPIRSGTTLDTRLCPCGKVFQGINAFANFRRHRISCKVTGRAPVATKDHTPDPNTSTQTTISNSDDYAHPACSPAYKHGSPQGESQVETTTGSEDNTQVDPWADNSQVEALEDDVAGQWATPRCSNQLSDGAVISHDVAIANLRSDINKLLVSELSG